MSKSRPGSAIRVRGARQHNLRHVDVDLPLGELIVVTGVSGSGKSSLAFSTLFAEGQRRYIESFSAFARQFLERMDKPDADEITDLPPAIAIDQTSKIRSARSTVGTITELNDYLKVLFARAGTVHCESCGLPVARTTVGASADAALTAGRGRRAIVTFPYLVGSSDEDLERSRAVLAQQGFHRAAATLPYDGLPELVDLAEATPSDGRLQIVADRLVLRERGRLVGSLETALVLGHGRATIWSEGLPRQAVADGLTCAPCDRSYRDPQPSAFSFNSPLGACPTCQGFGRTITVDLDRVIPHKHLTLAEGCVWPWQSESYSGGQSDLLAFCRKVGIPTDVAWRDISAEQRARVVNESSEFYGIRGFFQWLESRVYKMHVRVLLSRYRGYVTCTTCDGARLTGEALRVRVGGKSIAEVWALTAAEGHAFFSEIELPKPLDQAVELVLAEIRSRLRVLLDVGLDYLTLDRPSRTLSGGEVERVNLTAAIGSSLTSTLYVLDEPSIGLHPRDNARLRDTLLALRDNGNTVVVVEHDPELIRAADRVLDMGPGAGEVGGKIVFYGTYAGLLACDRSATGRYLAGDAPITHHDAPRAESGWLRVRGAREHNLTGVDLDIPVGTLTVVTGVSGSGKSTLVEDVIYRTIARDLGHSLDEPPGAHDTLEGSDLFDDIVLLDQSPVGRTPRGNPATYTKAWNGVRKLYGSLAASRARRLTESSFSFNTPGGRCDACEGQGFEKVEMQFLADVYVTCEGCNGTRFKHEIREVLLRGKSVVDVLQMTVHEALTFFAAERAIARALLPLKEVGLSYLRLGQPVSTLSGGESQRLKLAGIIAQRSSRRILFVMDEPTTGLHYEDVRVLLRVLDRLIDDGHSVIVVEHNLDLIAHADHIIDLGPEGGGGGGRVVAEGPPAVIARADTWTGKALAPVLAGGAQSWRGRTASKKRRPRAPGSILVSGAHEHNLKGVTVRVPRDKLTVVTGVSGSGKSTLAFDILYAEGQRRYLDSLSAYARQYIRVLPRPDVEHVEGIPPTIAIEQRVARPGANSTVATSTEIWHYLRLIYTRLGIPHCPDCGIEVAASTPDAIHEAVLETWKGREVRVLAPVVVARKGYWKPVFEKVIEDGHRGIRVDGELHEPPRKLTLDRYKEHDIEVVVEQMKVQPGERLRRALTQALELGDGTLMILDRGGRPRRFSVSRRCPRCGTSFPDADPRAFSFASRHGACPTCFGHGVERRLDPALLIDRTRTLQEGALLIYEAGPFARERKRAPKVWAERARGAIDRPLVRWSAGALARLEDGLLGSLEQQRTGSSSQAVREYLDGFAAPIRCHDCAGSRLKPASRAVRFAGRSIDEVAALSVGDARAWVASVDVHGRAEAIAGPPLKALSEKLEFLDEVGLGYLTLDRASASLAGGEAQRLRLAAQLGSGLRGVCYVLDEPTIGLHPRDGDRLVALLERLRDLGNTVVVVEHDDATIRAADWILDLGPGAGSHGGELIAQGTLDDLRKNEQSVTGQLIDARPRRSELSTFSPRGKPALTLSGVAHNNLDVARVDIPLGALVVVTGVSGSGKSSLIRDVLYRALMRRLHRSPEPPGSHRGLTGVENLDRVAEVDQTPIGRTPRSCPSTYVGFFDEIRKLFAYCPEAKARGYTASRFSFNVKGGRCEACQGRGQLKVEMSFLPDVYVTCDECRGRRFNRETLEVLWSGMSVADVLDLSIEDAVPVFAAIQPIHRALAVMQETGLGYLRLGQPSPELSGGEAQRVKLAFELAKSSAGRTLYILDEPTTGLHKSDVALLYGAMRRIVERGDTALVIEHNLDLIARADHVIDLGPEGGKDGGKVVAKGRPAELAERATTPTEVALRDYLATALA